jgi:predicted TPR repeat methyltransferase
LAALSSRVVAFPLKFSQRLAVKPAEIILPDAVAVGEAVKGWTATEPRFASMLKAGMPPVRALSGWGLDLLRAQRIDEGIDALRAALALAPHDPINWANYGMALAEGKLTGLAAVALEYSLKLLPQQPTTWLMLGLARKSLGQLDAAETAYRISLTQAPASGAAWQLIAAVKEDQRDFTGAIECMEASIKVDGESAAVLANLARLHYQMGHFADSCQAYGKAAGLDPSNAHFRQMAAKTTFLQAVLQGDPIEDAMASYQRAFGPGKTFSYEEKVDLLRSCFSILSGFAQVEAATRVGRKQMELCPTDPSLTYLLSAVSGDQSFDRSPAEYVVAHFDAFAEGFDAQLVGALGYDMPEKLCAKNSVRRSVKLRWRASSM